MLQRPGSSWGFGALLKDTSVVVLKEDTPPTNNPCQTWDSNPQPSGYKSNSLSIRPRQYSVQAADIYILRVKKSELVMKINEIFIRLLT